MWGARICPAISIPCTHSIPALRGIPVVVVDLCLRAHKLLLARLLGPVSADQIAVLLGLEHGNEVDARPHLLARKLAEREVIRQYSCFLCSPLNVPALPPRLSLLMFPLPRPSK
jgi:hypothetical protein